MKNTDDMARDVLERVHAYHARRARRRQVTGRAVLAVGCACLTALVCLAIPHIPEPGMSSGRPDASGTVPVCTSIMQAVYLSDGNICTEELTEAQEIPMWYRLQVEDTRIAHGDAECAYAAEYEAMMNESQHWMDKYGDEAARAAVLRFEDITVSLYSAGYIRLNVPSPQEVESIRAFCEAGYGKAEMTLLSSTLAGQTVPYILDYEKGPVELEKPVYDSGYCWLSGENITLPGDVYATVCADGERGEGDFYLRWKPSAVLCEALYQQPDTPLSAFSDRMIISVNYKDGTAEVHTLDILFEDNGVVTVNYMGTSCISE